MKKTFNIYKDFKAWAIAINCNSEDARRATVSYEKGLITFSELMATLLDEARNLRWDGKIDIE